MENEKRALSWREFVESGFDGREYQFPDFEGTFAATIACKRWNKSKNLLVYLDLDDGRKIITATWNCLLYTSPSPRDYAASRMPSSA